MASSFHNNEPEIKRDVKSLNKTLSHTQLQTVREKTCKHFTVTPEGKEHAKQTFTFTQK